MFTRLEATTSKCSLKTNIQISVVSIILHVADVRKQSELKLENNFNYDVTENIGNIFKWMNFLEPKSEQIIPVLRMVDGEDDPRVEVILFQGHQHSKLILASQLLHHLL